jgi:glycosyltransferase involved in cell wall biosynthesis
MVVSVIITNYNYASYLERAIRSALDQSLDKSAYEIIVVDDASTDESGLILENYKEMIRLIAFKENKGLSAARNEGIRKARGQFVVFLDADDYMQHDMLYIQKTFLSENNLLDAVSADYYLVDERGTHIKHADAEKTPIACGIMFRKDLLFNVGLYDESFRAREEEDFRIRFLKHYNIYNIILPLYRYRMHDNNLTKNNGVMKKFAKKLRKKHR